MILDREYLILPVDVAAAMSKGTVVGNKHGVFVEAVKAATDSFTGDGTTTSFNLTNAPVVPGSVSVTVDGVATTVDVDYDNGVITFATAPATGAAIVVDYSYYAAEPSGILAEDVLANQTPPAAKIQVFGVVYVDELAGTLYPDVRHKLLANGLIVKDREQV